MTRGEELRILEILDGSANIVVTDPNYGTVGAAFSRAGASDDHLVAIRLSSPANFGAAIAFELRRADDAYDTSEDLATAVLFGGGWVGFSGATVKEKSWAEAYQLLADNAPNAGGWVHRTYDVSRIVGVSGLKKVGMLKRSFNATTNQLVLQWITHPTDYAPPSAGNPLKLAEAVSPPFSADPVDYLLERFAMANVS